MTLSDIINWAVMIFIVCVLLAVILVPVFWIWDKIRMFILKRKVPKEMKGGVNNNENKRTTQDFKTSGGNSGERTTFKGLGQFQQGGNPKTERSNILEQLEGRFDIPKSETSPPVPDSGKVKLHRSSTRR